MKKLVIASNNNHKIEEIKPLLPKEYQIITLAEAGISDDIAETETTFEGNALLKARFVFNKTGFDCFADDSGLEVEALNGKPGVYSARYSGPGSNGLKNNQKLLTELANIENRKARFRTVIALIYKGREYLFEGIIEGKIGFEMKGKSGFGYDPLFVPEGKICTFAEMSFEEKNSISHRFRAVKKMVDFLEKQD